MLSFSAHEFHALSFRGATLVTQRSGSVPSQAERMANVRSLLENAPSSPPPSAAPHKFTVIFGAPITVSTVCRLIGNFLESKLPKTILGSRENPALRDIEIFAVHGFGIASAHMGIPYMISAIRRHPKNPYLAFVSRHFLPFSVVVLVICFILCVEWIILVCNPVIDMDATLCNFALFNLFFASLLSLPSLSRAETLSLSVDTAFLTVNSEGLFSSERKILLHEIRLFRNHRCQVQR